MQRRKEEEGRKKKKKRDDIFIFLSAFSLCRAATLLSAKSRWCEFFFFFPSSSLSLSLSSKISIKHTAAARLLFNFMFSLQEARLLLPVLGGWGSSKWENQHKLFQINLQGAGRRVHVVWGFGLNKLKIFFFFFFFLSLPPSLPPASLSKISRCVIVNCKWNICLAVESAGPRINKGAPMFRLKSPNGLCRESKSYRKKKSLTFS